MLTASSRRILPVCFRTAHPIAGHALREVTSVMITRGTRAVATSPSNYVVPAFATAEHLLDNYYTSPYITTDILPLARKMDAETDRMRKAFEATSPRYDISYDKAEVKIKVDVPGVKSEDVSVEILDKNVLHVGGERKTEKDGEVISEVKFERQFALGENLDLHGMTAKLDHGVLTITVPKVEVGELEGTVKIPVMS